MESDPLDRPATVQRLRALAAHGLLREEALDRALVIAEHRPTAPRWFAQIERSLLLLGVVLLMSGVLFFFAYNWQDMHRFVKFSLIGAATLVAVGAAFVRGLDHLVGKACLLAAALLIGVLLAVFGQVYQTGADSYQLFLVWSLLIVGWVAIGRFTPLWALLLALLNVLLATYYTQTQRYDDLALPTLLFLLNAAGLTAWEWASRGRQDWMQGRWLARLVALVAAGCVLLPTVIMIYGFPYLVATGSLFRVAPLLCAVFLGGLWFVYTRLRPDLFMLTVAMFSLIIVATTVLARIFSSTTGMLITALAVVGMTALAVVKLRQITEKWQASV